MCEAFPDVIADHETVVAVDQQALQVAAVLVASCELAPGDVLIAEGSIQVLIAQYISPDVKDLVVLLDCQVDILLLEA